MDRGLFSLVAGTPINSDSLYLHHNLEHLDLVGTHMMLMMLPNIIELKTIMNVSISANDDSCDTYSSISKLSTQQGEHLSPEELSKILHIGLPIAKKDLTSHNV